jgi:hypothetical protein
MLGRTPPRRRVLQPRAWAALFLTLFISPSLLGKLLHALTPEEGGTLFARALLCACDTACASLWAPARSHALYGDEGCGLCK